MLKKRGKAPFWAMRFSAERLRSSSMPWQWTDHRARLNLIGIIILLVGLGSAIFIYRCADGNGTIPWGYEEGNGSVYPIRPEDSKKYLRDLELYGGKANVLATELRLWLGECFQGKALAFTIAFLTIPISLGFLYRANYPSFRVSPGVRSKNHRR
jgi:hypothetical protein